MEAEPVQEEAPEPVFLHNVCLAAIVKNEATNQAGSELFEIFCVSCIAQGGVVEYLKRIVPHVAFACVLDTGTSL
jgi:hypothetical protein